MDKILKLALLARNNIFEDLDSSEDYFSIILDEKNNSLNGFLLQKKNYDYFISLYGIEVFHKKIELISTSTNLLFDDSVQFKRYFVQFAYNFYSKSDLLDYNAIVNIWDKYLEGYVDPYELKEKTTIKFKQYLVLLTDIISHKYLNYSGDIELYSLLKDKNNYAMLSLKNNSVIDFLETQQLISDYNCSSLINFLKDSKKNNQLTI